MLEAALAAGMTSAGAEVFMLGVIPTPGVSFAVKKTGMHGGAVISASHNPAEYNGIKFLDGEGYKLSDEMEASIEEYMGDNLTDDCGRPRNLPWNTVTGLPPSGAGSCLFRQKARWTAPMEQHPSWPPPSSRSSAAGGPWWETNRTA